MDAAPPLPMPEPTIAALPIAPAAPAVFPSTSAADLDAHRGAMLRFARRRIRDEDLAEDAVQDALASAIASVSTFQGQSQLRTWLIGILHHKIQDTFRRETRYVRLGDRAGDRDDDDGGDALADLLQADAPPMFDDPATAVSRRRMGEALVMEIESLPPTLREVFVAQVLEGEETASVCARLGITEANCWVRLHRARKRLAERMRAHLD